MSGAINIVNSRGNFAGIGEHAHANVATNAVANQPLDEIERELTHLTRLLEKHAGAVADRRAAEEALAQAKEELHSGGPRPPFLRTALNAIVGSAPGISAVADAVSAIKDLVGGLG